MNRLTATGITETGDWRALNDRLVSALKPFAPPLAISFHGAGEMPPAARVEVRYPPPNEHGRTGQVPAGCVFWIQGAADTFATVAADHSNCSVGSYTHGFITLEEAATKDAFPEMPIEGKPQCHTVAMAKDRNAGAASVGFALSRSRTGMRSEEMTCVIPGNRLPEVVETREATVGLDRAMARYASADAKRFG